jgi:hypothetical protein
MVDTTYQTKVYHKQGDIGIVVASGGTIEIESGGFFSNAGTTTLLSGATFNLNSGVTLSGGDSALGKFASGFIFYYGSLSTIPAFNQGIVLLNRLTVMTIKNSAGAGSGVLSVVSIPPRIGYVIINASGACSNGSLQLYSCIIGEELQICIQGAATRNSVSVAILASGGGAVGISLVGINGSALSRITMDFSAMQSCWVRFKAIADNCWSIMGASPTSITYGAA